MPLPAMGAVPPPGGAPLPSPMGTPPPAVATGPEKKKRPSIIFLVFDFLMFGGAIAGMIILFLQN
jgi:hypothetical protein